MDAQNTDVIWGEFAAECDDLASRMQARFESHLHAVMATLRRDGSPRMSGMEAPIRDGHLWLGMEHTSMKAADLRRDPRFGLHSAPESGELQGGDARIEGEAVPADASELETFLRGHHHEIDDSTSMALFTARIARAVLVRVESRHLVVETWTPASGLVERRVA
ncbi:pyridoxamine 5'-phosphate oxidase family protein [Candidatus Poriferisodalis sp.]|uniref:pyridoxamine 5'-phosphate oxidase family protein n=1 Tax=Candidatus Poriferisodalis sp. TaxID=3101277 RepID=UPI003B028E50